MAFKDFDNVDNETIEYENDEERLKDDDMEIGEGSPHVDCSGFSTCLPCQMSVQFFRSILSCQTTIRSQHFRPGNFASSQK